MEIIEEDIDVRTPTYSLEISPEVTEVPLKVEKVFDWPVKENGEDDDVNERIRS